MAPPNAAPREPGSGEPGDDDGLDVEARFAEIVSDLDGVSAPADGTRGDEPPGASGPGDSAPRGSQSFPSAPWVRPSGPRDWPTTPEVEALEEEQTHFTPPDPPLHLGRDPLLNLAWVLVVGVPLATLVLIVLLQPFPAVVGPVGAGLFLAGLGILIWRMPKHRDADDHDPGAVV